jgi:hypothetical protein
MIDRNRSLPCQYQVTVGHLRVTVGGASLDEVIEQARRALCVEMPRLYDVIRGLDVSRFQVVPLVHHPVSPWSGHPATEPPRS